MSDITHRVAKRHLEASKTTYFRELEGYSKMERFLWEIPKLTPDHKGLAKVYREILTELSERYSVDRDTDIATKKLLNLVSKNPSSPDMVRNQVFKIADLLGLKLPHSLF